MTTYVFFDGSGNGPRPILQVVSIPSRIGAAAHAAATGLNWIPSETATLDNHYITESNGEFFVSERPVHSEPSLFGQVGQPVSGFPINWPLEIVDPFDNKIQVQTDETGVLIFPASGRWIVRAVDGYKITPMRSHLGSEWNVEIT